eukprot:6950275-Pyramimonas_sp.AAC.1
MGRSGGPQVQDDGHGDVGGEEMGLRRVQVIRRFSDAGGATGPLAACAALRKYSVSAVFRQRGTGFIPPPRSA